MIVEDIDKALEISKKYKNSFRIVTKDGDIFNAGGSITGGSIFTSNSIFTRRKQISELEEMLKGLELKRCDIELEIKELLGVNDDLLLELSNKEKEADIIISELTQKINEENSIVKAMSGEFNGTKVTD